MFWATPVVTETLIKAVSGLLVLPSKRTWGLSLRLLGEGKGLGRSGIVLLTDFYPCLFYPYLISGVLCQTLPWVRAGLSPRGAGPGPGRAEGTGTVTPGCAPGTIPGGAGKGREFSFPGQPSATAGTEAVINQKLLMSQRDLCPPEGKLFPFVWEGEIIFWVPLSMPGKRN